MTQQTRTRTAELRRAQEDAARRGARRRRILTGIGLVVIVGLVAAIVVAVVRATGGSDSPARSAGRLVTPANLDASGAIPVGDAKAPVTMELYYDYMCPACGAMEKANGKELDRLVSDGTVRLELRPISFLDKASSGTKYSTRSANAMATVVDGAPERVWAFHTALYASQPEEGSQGLSDEQIAQIATDAGVPADVVHRFADRTYEPWVAEVTQSAFESGVQGTPTVLIDGKPFSGDLYTTGPLTAAIEKAAGG